MKKQKLVHGVGINDADYVVQPRINGKQLMCPVYQTWVEMLKRCYSPKYQAKQPTYIGCSVSERWLVFSNFKAWMDNQDWHGRELDKDICTPGNKIYSPDNCVFVTKEINALLNNHASARGSYPLGVSFHKKEGKIRATISKHGKYHHLGYYSSPELASDAYVSAKVAHIIEVASTQPYPIKSGLLKHAAILEQSGQRI